MKARFFLLSILSMTAVFTVATQDANAQAKERGARWSFAPNVYKVEQPRIPSAYDAPSTVRQGAMPQSSSFLGVDPSMLNSRPPQAIPQVAARPAAPSVSARAFVPHTAFHPSFGQPVAGLSAGQPVQMAQLPPASNVPQMAAPNVARNAAPAHYAQRPAARSHHSRAVSAKLRTPTRTVGQSATPQVASYSSGYMPGGHLPSTSGASSSHSATVSGRVMHH